MLNNLPITLPALLYMLKAVYKSNRELFYTSLQYTHEERDGGEVFSELSARHLHSREDPPRVGALVAELQLPQYHCM